jgi:hypothetical protein
MPTPSLPASCYTPQGALIGATLSGGVFWLGVKLGPLAFVLLSPFIAFPAAVPILVVLDWAFGRGQRAYRFGTGRQANWGYLGHTLRGAIEGQDIWLSLADCEAATSLALSKGLKAVPSSRRRKDDVRGLMLDRASMLRVIDACGEDMFALNRFRLFLERSVWMTRKG